MSDLLPTTIQPPQQLGLPEVQWGWRRWHTYVLTVIFCGLLAWLISRIDSPEALERLAWGCIAVIVLLILFYQGGATMTDLRRLAAVVQNAIPRFGRGTAP